MENPIVKQLALLEIRHRVKRESPLIHCITNPISINDCANAVLAVGAKPIMAEHPEEVCEITASAQALAVNLGNITDVRMKSMMLSGHTAREKQIPSILDLVGVGCSSLRRSYAAQFIRECHPTVIKGNLSEIKAICGVPCHAEGIDVGKEDQITPDRMAETGGLLRQLSQTTGAVAVATGATDLASDGKTLYAVSNGCKMLSMITGTGCMVTVLTAAYLSAGNPLASAVLAFSMMGIAGEMSRYVSGNGSFHTALMDSLSSLSDTDFNRQIHLARL